MTIRFRQARPEELADMNVDAQDFEAVDAVVVNGQTVGAFAVSEDGWGCWYIDRGTGQMLDFGDADEHAAKCQLRAAIRAVDAN